MKINIFPVKLEIQVKEIDLLFVFIYISRDVTMCRNCPRL